MFEKANKTASIEGNGKMVPVISFSALIRWLKKLDLMSSLCVVIFNLCINTISGCHGNQSYAKFDQKILHHQMKHCFRDQQINNLLFFFLIIQSFN